MLFLCTVHIFLMPQGWKICASDTHLWGYFLCFFVGAPGQVRYVCALCLVLFWALPAHPALFMLAGISGLFSGDASPSRLIVVWRLVGLVLWDAGPSQLISGLNFGDASPSRLILVCNLLRLFWGILGMPARRDLFLVACVQTFLFFVDAPGQVRCVCALCLGLSCGMPAGASFFLFACFSGLFLGMPARRDLFLFGGLLGLFCGMAAHRNLYWATYIGLIPGSRNNRGTYNDRQQLIKSCTSSQKQHMLYVEYEFGMVYF